MPGMNGKEVRDRILSIRPGIKSLFISGYPDHIIAGSGVLEESIQLLPKPFNEVSLCRKVRDVLNA
jgi:hypothetical protein